MKRCPQCRRDYNDDSLLYCLDDGSELVFGASSEEPATAVMPDLEAETRNLLPRSATVHKDTAVSHYHRGRQTKLFAVIFGAIIIAAGAFAVYKYRGDRTSTINSIAVLPFTNNSGNQDLEYISDGMPELLISSLSEIPDLQVKSRSSVYRFKGRDISARDAGRELGVDGIVTGTLTAREGNIVLYVELMDVATEQAIWSQAYDRPLGSLVSLQNDISRDFASKLRSKLSGTEILSKRYSQDPEAYKLYLQGRYYFNKYTEADLRKGIELFNQAIAVDPNSALAYSGLADTYVNLGTDFIPPKSAFPLAKAYAMKASELDNNLAESHAAMGAISFFYDWDWSAARRELEFIKAQRPDTTEPYACTLHYSDVVEDPSNAVDEIREVNERHPTSLIINSEIGCASYYARRFDQAVLESQKTIELDAGYGPAYFNMGRAYGQERKYDEAIAALNKAAELLDGNSHVIAELAYVYGVSGKTDKALAARRQLEQIAKRRYVDSYLWAIVESGAGNKEKSLSDLEQALEDRSTWMPWLRLEAKFDYLRTEPRFQTLMKRLNLAPTSGP